LNSGLESHPLAFDEHAAWAGYVTRVAILILLIPSPPFCRDEILVPKSYGLSERIRGAEEHWG